MNTLVWDGKFGIGYIIKNQRHTALRVKPSLDFEFEDLVFQDGGAAQKNTPEGLSLNEEEKRECLDFIENFDIDLSDLPRNVYGIGENGEFLGIGRVTDFERHTIKAPPPGHHYYDFSETRWKWVYGVDSFGIYIGNVSPNEADSIAASAPPDIGYWRYDGSSGKWVEDFNLERERNDALQLMDRIINDKRNLGLEAQDIIYDEKAKQATKTLDLLDKGETIEEEDERVKMITIENKIDENLNLRQIAQGILEKHSARKELLKDTEIIRREIKSKIEKATDKQGLENCLEELNENIQGIG